MSLHTIFLLVMAGFTFFVLPIVMIWSMIDFLGGKKNRKSARRGGGGVSSFVGGAMVEMDRFVRPSVEYTIEAEDEKLQDAQNDGE